MTASASPTVHVPQLEANGTVKGTNYCAQSELLPSAMETLGKNFGAISKFAFVGYTSVDGV